MRVSQLLRTHDPSSEDRSDLLAYAGYTHRLADGVYTLLPLGQRVLSRISAIVRRELERVGAQEVTMPLLQPEGLWQRPLGNGQTRAAAFGAQLFRLHAQGEQRWVLAPTHEEVAAVVAAACVRSTDDLPRVLYQIQPRFRDQECPGEGLLRTREFVMADAYSFHADRASLDQSYAAIKQALCVAVARCGVELEAVLADCGAMGGEESEELLAMLPNAPTVGVRCKACGHAASLDVAEVATGRPATEMLRPLEEIALGDGLSLEQSAALLGVSPKQRLTWVPFVAGGRALLAVMPGDARINWPKLVHVLTHMGIEASDLHPTSAEELTAMGGTYDWISLVRTPSSVLVVADRTLAAQANYFLPSTRVGHFLINANSGRDFRVDRFGDLSVAMAGAECPRCGHAMEAIAGIEIGHVFKLGSHFTASFGAQIEGEGKARQPIAMGCYGLGLTRLMATLVEQRRDERGIVWPERVAPYGAVLVPRPTPGARRAAEQLYHQLDGAGLEVLLDDSGAAFEDKLRRAALLGIPRACVVSDPRDGVPVELRERSSPDTRLVQSADLGSVLRGYAERAS